MRVARLRMNKFGPFNFQEIDLAPLTILFGANGAGKSTILQAVEDALTLSDRQGPLGSGSSSATVYATLDDRMTPETSDERIMRHVLWKNMKGIDDTRTSLTDPYAECPSLDELLYRKATELVNSGPHGTRAARYRIAAHLIGRSVLAFGGIDGDSGSWGLVCFASLDELTEVADMIDSPIVGETEFEVADSDVDAGDDILLDAVRRLRIGEDAILTREWVDSPQRMDRKHLGYSNSLLGKIRPLPMRLDFDFVTLDLELEGLASQIATLLTPSSGHFHGVPWLIVNHRAKDESIDESMDDPDVVSTLPEVQVTHNGARAINRPDPPRFDEYVVSPLIRNAVERIASRANLIAPSFITDDYQISIDVIDPSKWGPGAPRLRATMSQNGMSAPLSRAGSGIARWASLSIRLACQELLSTTMIGDPSMESMVTSYKGVAHLRREAAGAYAAVAALEAINEDGSLDVVLLIDEPEAHLHPRAVVSVGQWLIDISERVASVVVATHHPTLFNLRAPSNQENIQKQVVFKTGRESSVKRWNPGDERLVAQLASEIGLTSGDLFMMSRYVLFVEGPHDLAILEEFFGDMLKANSIRLLPLHGANNISMIAESEIVWSMGIPMGVLTDGTNVERVQRGERSNYVEKLVVRLLREVKAAGRTVDTFGISFDDILFCLDDDVTASLAEGGFPGWGEAQKIWRDRDQPANVTANGSKFKEWVTSTYSLRLDRDSVREIAKKCKEAGMISEELSKVVTDIVTKVN